MARFELKLPKMGESVAEATITNWLKEVGDTVEVDEAVVEIATDKVDSDVPSEIQGILVEKLFKKDDLVKVGQTFAIIETGGGTTESVVSESEVIQASEVVEKSMETARAPQDFSDADRFYSPLVRNIAATEGIALEELDAIAGTGKDGRVTKNDILDYVTNKKSHAAVPSPDREVIRETTSIPVQEEEVVPEIPKPIPAPPVKETEEVSSSVQKEGAFRGVTNTETFKVKTTPIQNGTPIQGMAGTTVPPVAKTVSVSINGADEIIEMDRMGKMIAHHMIQSIQTSAHVQSFIEVDVTNIWKWREKNKDVFEKREGEKLTFTPIFMEAVAKAIKDFPLVNISVDGDRIIKKKNINLGMAAALPSGNLIVPVIKNADQLNLVGMAKAVNDLAARAKNNRLKPDDIQEGTYTVTNIGTFGSIFGTPIINQPQVAILALGAIRKVPAVIETSEGDFIGIRHKMFLSHSYDHRVINGALGGQFVKRVAEYLEEFDINRDF